MSKYNRLTFHLASLDENSWTANFSELEQIIGLPLPQSAREHQAWWSNQKRSQSLAWQSAGWKTTGLDLKREKVTFVYAGGDDPEEASAPVRSMSLAEAKEGLAATFGVSPSQVDITIRG